MWTRRLSSLGCVIALLCGPVFALEADRSSGLAAGLPLNTKLTKLGDEIYLNGIPAEIVGIAVPASIKETTLFFAKKWTADGWRVKVERNGDFIAVTSNNGTLQRVAMLTKTGEDSTEGSLSMTDLPLRLTNGGGPQLPVAEHLLKPSNTTVLNEVRVRDQMGESIMTTMANQFDVEQNVAFYRERMVEEGWKEKKHKTVSEGRGVIVEFERPGKDASFTVVKQGRQTFVNVNWINH